MFILNDNFIIFKKAIKNILFKTTFYTKDMFIFK